MKKSDLKRVLKPIVEECIKDVLLEGGLLSNVISEVVRGLNSNVIVEKKVVDNRELDTQRLQILEEKQRRLKEQKRKMLNATGFGADIFEGTEPISQAGAPDSQGQGGALAGVDPNDAGVDLSGIMAVSGRSWKDMI